MTGTGTVGDPFIASSPADLDAIRNDVGATGDLTYYELGQSIDMASFGVFTPIPACYINFDGKGFEIQNMTIEENTEFGGMFSEWLEGSPSNVVYKDCLLTMTPSGPTFPSRFGICVGKLTTTSPASNIAADGCTITLNPDQNGSRIGILIGVMESDSEINNSYATGCTINTKDGAGRIGGFVGEMSFGSTTEKCWASTDIVVNGTLSNVGGFCGSASSGANQNDCFWDTDVGFATSAGDSTGKTTTEMFNIDTYTDTVNTVGLDSAYDMVDVDVYNNETWSIDDTLAYPILGYQVVVNTKVGGTIRLSGNVAADARVDIMRSVDVTSGVSEVVETVTADGSGVYLATLDRVAGYNYWAAPRYYVEEFTGTLTPVSGTTFSTGVDLSGVSIGGENDPLYVLKSTGGTLSGEEVAVTSRSGNDIALSYDPGFDGTTTFSLGKAYLPGDVFPKSAAV